MKEQETNTKAFLTYFDSEVMYKMLSNEEAGKLIKAMFRYCKDKEETLTMEDGTPYAYFAVLQQQFDRDKAKYDEMVAKKRKRDKARYAKQKGLPVELANEEDYSDMSNDTNAIQDNSNIIRLEGDNVWKWQAFQMHLQEQKRKAPQQGAKS